MSAACSGGRRHVPELRGLARRAGTSTCGTSEATPLFAGIVALADQVAGHAARLDQRRRSTALGGRRAPGIVDVTHGNNTVTFFQPKSTTVTGFDRGAFGYDLASGLGTIDAGYLVPELAGKWRRRRELRGGSRPDSATSLADHVDVGGDLGDERRLVGEALLGAHEVEHAHLDDLTVQVAVEVEEVGLDQPALRPRSNGADGRQISLPGTSRRRRGRRLRCQTPCGVSSTSPPNSEVGLVGKPSVRPG